MIDISLDSYSISEVPVSIERIRKVPGILQNLGTAIVICDDRLNIVLLNPSAQSLLDVSEKQVLGESILTYFRSEETETFLNRSIDELRSTTLRHTEFLDSNRRIKLVDCILTPSSIKGSLHLILEINEVSGVVRQLLENSAVTGENANTAVLRSAAHEIKNPLGGLRGAAQLLEQELNDQHELKDYTNIIIREADRLCGLIDDMSGTQVPLRLSQFNIHKVLEYVRTLILAEQPEGLNVIRDYDPSLPDIEGDQEQLIQVFINIMRNAMEAFDDIGTLTIRTRVEHQVTLGKKRYRSAAKIEIEDNGPGIPAELVDQIFFPLISGKPKGEGLGLSIVRQIITRHEGSVSCHSRPKRTCFTVLLRFANQAAIPDPIPSQLNGVSS